MQGHGRERAWAAPALLLSNMLLLECGKSRGFGGGAPDWGSSGLPLSGLRAIAMKNQRPSVFVTQSCWLSAAVDRCGPPPDAIA
jgi:hypothetical protein